MNVYSLWSVIDDLFDSGASLLDDICHPDDEIVHDSLQHVIQNSDFSLDVFFQPVNCTCVALIHSLLQVAPEKVVRRAQIKSRVAMDCQSSSRLIGNLVSIAWSIEECGRNSEVVHDPVETQLYSCQNPFSSLMPEWSVSEAFRCIGVHSLSTNDHHHFQKSMGQKYHSFQVHTILLFFSTLSRFSTGLWGCSMT